MLSAVAAFTTTCNRATADTTSPRRRSSGVVLIGRNAISTTKESLTPCVRFLAIKLSIAIRTTQPQDCLASHLRQSLHQESNLISGAYLPLRFQTALQHQKTATLRRGFDTSNLNPDKASLCC